MSPPDADHTVLPVAPGFALEDSTPLARLPLDSPSLPLAEDQPSQPLPIPGPQEDRVPIVVRRSGDQPRPPTPPARAPSQAAPESSVSEPAPIPLDPSPPTAHVSAEERPDASTPVITRAAPPALAPAETEAPQAQPMSLVEHAIEAEAGRPEATPLATDAVVDEPLPGTTAGAVNNSPSSALLALIGAASQRSLPLTNPGPQLPSDGSPADDEPVERRREPASRRPPTPMQDGDDDRRRERTPRGWLGRIPIVKPRRTLTNVYFSGAAAAPTGYMDAVARLLDKQAGVTWKTAADIPGAEWPIDDLTRQRLARSRSVDEELAARFRRIVFDLDLGVQTRILSRWARCDFFLPEDEQRSWLQMAVGSLLRYRCAAALAYEWIDSSYGPCRHEAARAWRMSQAQAHDIQTLLSDAICTARADVSEIQPLLDGFRDDVGEILPASEPDWQCQLIRWGLRRRLDEELREEFQAELDAVLRPLGLKLSL
jgi:hypothetical protein